MKIFIVMFLIAISSAFANNPEMFSSVKKGTRYNLPCLVFKPSCNVFDMEQKLLDKCYSKGYIQCITAERLEANTGVAYTALCGDRISYTCVVRVLGKN